MSENIEAAAPAAEAEPVSQETVQAPQEGANTGEDASPAEADEGEAEEAKPKGGFQRRISELTYRVRDTERDRDHWRDLAIQLQRSPQPQSQQYAEPEGEFDEGHPPQVDTNAVILTVRQQLEAEQRLSSFEAKVRESYPDGEPEGISALRNAPGQYATPAIFDLVTGSDIAPKVADYLGINQTELRRLASLPPHRQGFEFARLEDRIRSERSPVTRAPPPAPTLGVRSAPVERDPDKMSTKEWMAWREAQLRKS